MSGIELPQTIKLIVGGSVQGIISFKATQIYKKPLSGNSFDSSSSEYEEDPGMKPAMLTNLTLMIKWKHNTVGLTLTVIVQVMNLRL